MKNILSLGLMCILLTGVVSCDRSASPEPASDQLKAAPYARYWWFASEIKREDVRYNLNWLKDHGFGGVELAWVYPLNSRYEHLDSSYTPRQEWLGPQWQDIVEYTIKTFGPQMMTGLGVH